MGDISKCSGENCAKRHECYRFISSSGFVQSWLSAEECIKHEYNLYYPWTVNLGLSSKSELDLIDNHLD